MATPSLSQTPHPKRTLGGSGWSSFRSGGGHGGPSGTPAASGDPAHVGRDHRPPPMAPGAQEEEDRDESGCEEEEGREDEDEDSGSEESLVDSDSDPEEKGACACAGAGAWGGASCHRQTRGGKALGGRPWSGDRPPSPQISETVGV